MVRVVENLLLFSTLLTLGIHLDAEDPAHEAIARDAFFVLLGLYLMLLCPLLFYHTVASIRACTSAHAPPPLHIARPRPDTPVSRRAAAAAGGHRPGTEMCCSGPGLLAAGLVLAIAVQYVFIIVKVEKPKAMDMGTTLLPLAFCGEGRHGLAPPAPVPSPAPAPAAGRSDCRRDPHSAGA